MQNVNVNIKYLVKKIVVKASNVDELAAKKIKEDITKILINAVNDVAPTNEPDATQQVEAHPKLIKFTIGKLFESIAFDKNITPEQQKLIAAGINAAIRKGVEDYNNNVEPYCPAFVGSNGPIQKGSFTFD